MSTRILPQRTAITLEGPDTLALLERLVTNNTHDWDTGAARYGALLTPQGKIIADFIALRTETGALLDSASEAAGDLAKRLKMFRLRAKVEIEESASLKVALDEDGFADPRSPGLPNRGFVSDGDHPEAQDWNALRLKAGVAEWGEDFVAAEVFPWEINMDHMGGVDLKKGCFVGQEVVSRIHRKGSIRKRSFRIEGEGLAQGAEIMGETALGDVTSCEGSIGIARLRTDRLAKAEAAGQSLQVNGKPVTLHKTDWLEREVAAHSGNGT